MMKIPALRTAFIGALAASLSACGDDPVEPPSPPTISLQLPASAAVIDADSVRVRGRAAAPEGLRELSFSLDGEASVLLESDPSATSAEFEFVLRDLAEGDHQLEVAVTDHAGQRQTAGRAFAVALVEPPFDTGRFRLVEFSAGFERPLHVTAPKGDERLFVVEQWGRIMVVRDGSILPTPFLDIRDEVHLEGEQGLLGLAFDPEYASSGEFYISYIGNDRDTRIARYRVSSDPDRAEPGSAEVILVADQPDDSPIHKAGTLQFGPDGYLYIPLGDAGLPDGSADIYGNAQDPGTLLGSVLRIDVNTEDGYRIPADNPAPAGADARGEIIAFGLRNPWRMSVDPVTGVVYIPDVGQSTWEEINVLEGFATAVNYGWPEMEGRECYGGKACDTSRFVGPDVVEPHDAWCSVTGGEVYRGSDIPELRGHYVYGDLCSGLLSSFRYQDGEVMEKLAWETAPIEFLASISSDGRGELYFTSIVAGKVYRLEAP